MQVAQAAELDQPRGHRPEVEAGGGCDQRRVVIKDLRMQQLYPRCGRDEEKIVSERVEPSPPRRFLIEAPRDVPVEKIGRTGDQQAKPDSAPAAEQSCPPEGGYEQQAQQGQCARQPPARAHVASMERERDSLPACAER